MPLQTSVQMHAELFLEAELYLFAVILNRNFLLVLSFSFLLQTRKIVSWERLI